MPYNCFESYNININSKNIQNLTVDNIDDKNMNVNNNNRTNDDNVDGSKDSNSNNNTNSNNTYNKMSTLNSISRDALESVFTLDLKWYIGGAISVDKTWISLHKAPMKKPGEGFEGTGGTPKGPGEGPEGIASYNEYYDNWSNVLEELIPPSKVPPFAPSSSFKEPSPSEESSLKNEKHLNNEKIGHKKNFKKKRDRVLEGDDLAWQNLVKRNMNAELNHTNKMNMNHNKKRILSDEKTEVFDSVHLSYAQKGVYTCMYIYMYTYLCIYMYTYTCIYMFK